MEEINFFDNLYYLVNNIIKMCINLEIQFNIFSFNLQCNIIITEKIILFNEIFEKSNNKFIYYTDFFNNIKNIITTCNNIDDKKNKLLHFLYFVYNSFPIFSSINIYDLSIINHKKLLKKNFLIIIKIINSIY